MLALFIFYVSLLSYNFIDLRNLGPECKAGD